MMKHAFLAWARRLGVESRSLRVPALAALLAAVAVWAILRSAAPPPRLPADPREAVAASQPGSDDGQPDAAPEPAPPEDPPAQAASKLLPWDWPDRPAEVFAGKYADWVARLADLPEKRRAQVSARFQRLSADKTALALIEREPELAFPLAMTIRPERLEAALNDAQGTDRRCLLNLLLLHGEPSAMERLLAAWEVHRSAIVDLWDRGLYGSESVFLFDRQDVDREYDLWLHDLLGPAADPAEMVLGRLGLVLAQGSSIRDRLRRDSDFRARFRSDLWPMLNRITADEDRPLAIFASHPAVWDLLRLADGEKLTLAYGLIPAALLFGAEAYPEDLQQTVIRLLLLRRQVVFDSLTDPVLCRDQSFRKFLARGGLNDDDLCTALARLEGEKAAGSRSEMLRHYLDTPPAALAEEFDVTVDFDAWDDSLPSYLKVASRIGQGKSLDPGDWQKAAIEATGDLAGLLSEPIGAALSTWTGMPVPGYAVKATSETLKAGASNLVDQAFRQELERRANDARRGQAPLSREDASLVEAEERRPLLDQAILDQLQKMDEAARDERPGIVGQSIRFFHARVPACERRLPDLERQLKTARVVDGWLVGQAEVATSPDETPSSLLKTGAWAEGAARWWQAALMAIDGTN